jgi:pimeloyl-ACP methyl ester carboxylesterase
MATVLLIPGADAHAWYWHRVAPLLATEDHEPVTTNMPTTGGAGLAAWTEAAVGALRGRVEDLVVVAQSIGGFVGPLVCERVPARLLILVNAMVPAPGETAGQWWDNTGQPAARAADAPRVGRDPDAGLDIAVDFFHDVPADITAQALAAPASSPSDRFFADPWPLPAWPAVPTRLLQGVEDRLLPLEFQRRVARNRLGIDIQPLPGGHLNALSRPDALAEAISGHIRG